MSAPRGAKRRRRWNLPGGLLLLATGWAHAGTVHYYYTDPQGTVLAKADAQGHILATYDYAPYGSQALGTPPDGPGYTGHVNDPESGLVYMQARYYDPSTGRFLSVDPVGSAPGNVFNFNRYGYANNNPVVNVDPDGRCTGSHVSNGDGSCASTGEFTTKASSAHSLSVEQAKIFASKNSLTYSVFSPVSRGQNGEINTSIIWGLKHPSKKGGYIIQHIGLSASKNLEIPDQSKYYEAGRVNPGQNQIERMASGNYNWDDEFTFSGAAGHGTIKWEASARFYEGLSLPASFRPNSVVHAGPLPATADDPHLSSQNATDPVNRTLSKSCRNDSWVRLAPMSSSCMDGRFLPETGEL